jgi:hypothetical protein
VKSLLRRRPSPAMVIALIALFVSLSGVSYGVATGFIDSREIKNNEVRSRDIRNNEIRTRDLRNNEVRGIDIRNSTIQSQDIALNAVTGNDVKEDTLQKVPSAATADTATSAGSVNGVQPVRIAFAGETGGSFTDVVTVAGLTLQARCAPVTGDLEVQASTSVPNGEISSNFDAMPTTNLDFDPGETVAIATVNDSQLGQATYAGSDGRVVTFQALGVHENNGVRGTTNDCGFFGVAEAG